MEKIYEIRLDGQTKCQSSIPRCGYTPRVMKSLLDAGYKYYIDGRYQKRSEAENG